MIRALLLVMVIGLIPACSDEKAPDTTPAEATAPENEPDLSAQLRKQVAETVDASCARTQKLANSVSQFLDSPTPANLVQTEDDWRSAHLAFRRVDFLYSLTDLPEPQMFGERDPIDATPILAGYLDQVPGYPNTGLVYSEVPLSPDFLRKEHQSTDFYYLTLGFHPLEVLLWPSADQTQADKVAAFVLPDKRPENEINVVAQRRKLTGLIADQLQRDMAPLCEPRNVAYLLNALVELKNQRVSVLTRVKKRLTETTGSTLQGWATHPDGEDRNGLPVSHSPRARSEFSEMATLTGELRERWLPVFLDGFRKDSADVDKALAGLASQLREISAAKAPIPTDQLKSVRQQLATVKEKLEAGAGNQR